MKALQRYILPFATFLLVVIFIFDLFVPLVVSSSFIYVAPILLTYFIKGKNWAFGFAIAGTGLTVAGYFLSTSSPQVLDWEIQLNRSLSVITIWLATLFLLGYRRFHEVSVEKQSHFRALFEGASDGILLVDDKGTIVMMNPKCQQLFGYEQSELTGQPIETLVPPGIREKHKQHREKFMNHPRPRPMGQGIDLYAHRKDGSMFPVEISLSYINTQKGFYVTAFISDITERKRWEEELQKSEERFSSAFHAAPIAIAITRAQDGILIDVNKSFLETFGYKRDEAISKTVWELGIWYKKEDRQIMDSLIEKGEQVEDFHMMACSKQGQIRHVFLSVEKIELDGEDCLLSMFKDMTERRKIEQDLLDERNFVSAIIDTTTALIAVLDREGNIVRFNKAAEEFTGLDRDEIFGRNLFELNIIPHEEQNQIRQQAFDQLIQQKTRFTYENHWIDKNGDWRLISWSNASLMNQEGEIEHVISAGIDITERKEMETKLMQAAFEGEEKERRRLGKDLHDGITPMIASVKNYLQALQPEMQETLHEEKRSYFDQSLQQLNEVITDIRNLSHNLMPKVLEERGIAEALEHLSDKISQHQGTQVQFYAVGIPSDLYKATEMSLYRIVQELLNNATKHAQADEITVQLIGDKESLLLSVDDNGQGFDVKKVKHAGDRIGLKNIDSRVKALRGQMHIESSYERGTLMTIEIPLDDNRQNKEQPKAKEVTE